MTLLEKAKAVATPPDRNANKSDERLKEECELSIAYFTGTISMSQASKVLGASTKNCTYTLAAVLGEGIRRGFIKVELVRK